MHARKHVCALLIQKDAQNTYLHLKYKRNYNC